MNSKVLIFSDIHIHPHKKSSERLQDCLQVLEWVLQEAYKNNISEILFLGDLFHDRQKIDILTYQRTFEIFREYFKGKTNIYLLLGNHDMWFSQKWEVSSVMPLSAIPGVNVIDSPKTIKILGKNISFLPYSKNPIQDLELLETKDKFLLCSHLALAGATLNKLYGTLSDESIEHDGEMIKVDSSLFKDWKQVFLGHYHNAQILNNVEYIGSPLQLDFGEAFQEKHILIYDLETLEKTYIKNNFSPEHVIINEQEININLKNKFVRLEVDDITSLELTELKNELSKKNVRSIKFQQKKKQEDKTVENAKAILYHDDEMLEKYINSMQLGSLNKDKLLTIGRKICE